MKDRQENDSVCQIFVDVSTIICVLWLCQEISKLF